MQITTINVEQVNDNSSASLSDEQTEQLKKVLDDAFLAQGASEADIIVSDKSRHFNFGLTQIYEKNSHNKINETR